MGTKGGKTAVWLRRYSSKTLTMCGVGVSGSYRGRFYDVMDMKAFPFDRQVLHLCLASDEPVSQMEYVKHPSGKTNSMLYENLAEWRLDNPNGSNLLEPVIYHDVLGSEQFGFQRYIVQIRVERRYMYYIWNVGFTIFLIVLLSITTWSINPTIVGERLAVTLTLVLSLVAFKVAISTTIPKVPYLTYLDYYLILASTSLSLVAAENAICAHIGDNAWDDSPSKKQNQLDRWFFIFFTAAWILLNFIFLMMATRGYFFMPWSDIEASDETRTVFTHAEDGAIGGINANDEHKRLTSRRPSDAVSELEQHHIPTGRRNSRASQGKIAPHSGDDKKNSTKRNSTSIFTAAKARTSWGVPKWKRSSRRSSTLKKGQRQSAIGNVGNSKQGSIIGARR